MPYAYGSGRLAKSSENPVSFGHERKLLKSRMKGVRSAALNVKNTFAVCDLDDNRDRKAASSRQLKINAALTSCAPVGSRQPQLNQDQGFHHKPNQLLKQVVRPD